MVAIEPAVHVHAERRRGGRVRGAGLRSNFGWVLDVSPTGVRVRRSLLSWLKGVGRGETVMLVIEGVCGQLSVAARAIRWRSGTVCFEFANPSDELRQQIARLRGIDGTRPGPEGRPRWD